MGGENEERVLLSLESGGEEFGVDRKDFWKAVGCLEGPSRAIFVLRVIWGFHAIEIGNCFGISEGRVCQELKEIQNRVRKALSSKVPKDGQGKDLFEENVEDLLSENGAIEPWLEPEAFGGLAEEKSFKVETDNEASLDEWFAQEMVSEEQEQET